MRKPCSRVTYVTARQRSWTFQGWRGSPLVDSPAEGATRRAVTVYRDRPAPQPLREQEQIRAADATVAGTARECPTGPRRFHSLGTGSPAFGGELPARPVCLRERISGTPQPTGVTGAPFYTAFRVEFCVAKQHYSTHLSTLLACQNRQPVTAVFRLDNQSI